MDVSDRRWFQETLRTGRFAAGDSVLSRLRGVASIHYGLAVHGPDGRPVAVLFASVNASQVAAQGRACASRRAPTARGACTPSATSPPSTARRRCGW